MTQKDPSRQQRRDEVEHDSRKDREGERQRQNVFDTPAADKEDQADSGPDRDNPITERSRGTS